MTVAVAPKPAEVETVEAVDERLARIAEALRRARFTNRDLTEAERLALRQNLLDKADSCLDARLDLSAVPE